MSLFGTVYMTELINCFEHSDPGSNFLIVCCFCFSCVVHLKKPKQTKNCATATRLSALTSPTGLRNQSTPVALELPVVLSAAVAQCRDIVGLTSAG